MALLRYLTKGKSALPDKSTCPSLTRKEVCAYRREATAKFKSANILFRPLGTKPPNLKIANISGYTVCVIPQNIYTPPPPGVLESHKLMGGGYTVLHNIYTEIVLPIVNKWDVASICPTLKGGPTNRDSVKRQM